MITFYEIALKHPEALCFSVAYVVTFLWLVWFSVSSWLDERKKMKLKKTK